MACDLDAVAQVDVASNSHLAMMICVKVTAPGRRRVYWRHRRRRLARTVSDATTTLRALGHTIFVRCAWPTRAMGTHLWSGCAHEKPKPEIAVNSGSRKTRISFDKSTPTTSLVVGTALYGSPTPDPRLVDPVEQADSPIRYGRETIDLTAPSWGTSAASENGRLFVSGPLTR
jgi:hypothetical protein